LSFESSGIIAKGKAELSKSPAKILLKTARMGKMKSNKRFAILVLMLVTVPLAPQAFALPSDGVLPGWGPDSVFFDYTSMPHPNPPILMPI
jgi:hypothetical protein